MANFRDITQVEEITTFTESDKLIVNSDGKAKQIGIDLIAGGVPDGGTAGQVLTKTSDVDGEAEWSDPVNSWNDLTDKPLVIKTAIIKSSDYDNTIAGLQVADAVGEEVTFTCLNMTFEEAYQTMAMGEPLSAIIMVGGDGAMNIYGMCCAFGGVMMAGVPCIGVLFELFGTQLTLYWTADGLSIERPGQVS